MRTKFNVCLSNVASLKYGVPQGSAIRPIHFLCYINDIVGIAESNNVNISLYADDLCCIPHRMMLICYNPSYRPPWIKL